MNWEKIHTFVWQRACIPNVYRTCNLIVKRKMTWFKKLWVWELYKHFIKGDIGMANNYTEKHSKSFAFRVKKKWSFNRKKKFTPIRVTQFPMTYNIKCWWRRWATAALIHCSLVMKSASSWKTLLWFLTELYTYLMTINPPPRLPPDK